MRKEAWPFYRTSSGVRLCWELEEPKGPEGLLSGATRQRLEAYRATTTVLLKAFGRMHCKACPTY